MLRVLLAIWPDAPRHLLVHCLVHDIGEIVSGDPPYPVKRNNPDLKVACERIEREAHLAMVLPWGLPPPQNLSEVEYAVFKAAEFIEMWEWGLYEMSLGNCHAHLVVLRCREAAGALPVPLAVAAKVITYMERREKQHGQVCPPSVPGGSRPAGRQGTAGEGH